MRIAGQRDGRRAGGVRARAARERRACAPPGSGRGRSWGGLAFGRFVLRPLWRGGRSGRSSTRFVWTKLDEAGRSSGGGVVCRMVEPIEGHLLFGRSSGEGV